MRVKSASWRWMPSAMFEWFSSVFDVTFLATIGLIFAATLVGAYFRSRRRDPCLKSFEGFHVTLERSDGKVVWGVFELESTGLELRYRDSVQDSNHVESSYILYSEEYGDLRAIYRYADDLSDENRRRRYSDIEHSFHPGPMRRMGRAMRHFLSTAAESINDVIGIFIGRLKKPAGRYISDTGETHLKSLGSMFIGHVGHAHDPLLERFIGQKMVVEILETNDEIHEHVGIFKNYSPDFVEMLDIQYPKHQALIIDALDCEDDCIRVWNGDGTLNVKNLTEQPVLLQHLVVEQEEELLNVVLDAGMQIELNLDNRFEKARLHFRVVRELDIVVPRTRCLIRHRADQHNEEQLSEIIFDLGVVLTGGSKSERLEQRLREQLERAPNAALASANLGALLMRRQEHDEARLWLSRAMQFHLSLPDNGRRTKMLLNELNRRTLENENGLRSQSHLNADVAVGSNGNLNGL